MALPSPRTESFQPSPEAVDALGERWADVWRSTPEDPLPVGRAVSSSARQANEARVEDWLGRLERRLAARRPGEDDDREILALVDEAATMAGAGRGEREELVGSPALLRASRDFVDRARRFAPDLDAESLGQALRNAWVMLVFERLLGLEVACTPAVFGYSMLYPFTDNRLDRAGGSAALAAWCERLEERLRGGEPIPCSPHEADVHRLVGEIERSFDRDRHPEVWASVLAIHRAQVSSLGQQGREPGADAVLRLSCAKGGTSVLADGFLVAGRLEPEDADFFFGYGVALQLLDDFEDATADRRARHWTLFSRPGADLDRGLYRLRRFVERVLASSRRLGAPSRRALRGLVRRSCAGLVAGAVAGQEELFAEATRRHVEATFPVRFSFLRRRRARFRDRAIAALERELGRAALDQRR